MSELRMPAIASASSSHTPRTTTEVTEATKKKYRSLCVLCVLCGSFFLLRQRIGAHLELHHLARRALPGLHMEGRARADRRPQPFAFPPARRIVDAAVHPFRVEPEWVRDAHHHPVPVL